MVEVKVENGLYYENFVQEPDEQRVAELDKQIERSKESPPELQVRAEAYQKAGLSELFRELKPDPNDIKRLEAERPLRLLGLAPMTKDELRVWHTWLPKAYVTDDDQHLLRTPGHQLRRLRQELKLRKFHEDHPEISYIRWYKYSDVPIEVAEQLASMRGKFDFMYILTPEERYSQSLSLADVVDPVLIGVRNKQHWLLARWGEVDPRTLDYDTLKKSVSLENWVRRNYNERNRSWLGLGLFSGFVGTIVTCVLATAAQVGYTGLTTEDPRFYTDVTVGIAVAGGLGAALLVNWHWFARPVGKLIARWRFKGVEKLL